MVRAFIFFHAHVCMQITETQYLLHARERERERQRERKGKSIYRNEQHNGQNTNCILFFPRRSLNLIHCRTKLRNISQSNIKYCNKMHFGFFIYGIHLR